MDATHTVPENRPLPLRSFRFAPVFLDFIKISLHIFNNALISLTRDIIQFIMWLWEVIIMMTETSKKGRITYHKLFWLFMAGSLLGVVLEGFWCLIGYGKWETHVVSMWGPFCIIYGFGAAGFYIGSVLMEKKSVFLRFLVFALIGSGVEYICGWILEHGLNMEAWNYRAQFLNINGYISLKMTIIWDAIGTLFGMSVPKLDMFFEKMQGKAWNFACGVLSVFMAVNLMFTAVCIVRWSQRHQGIAASGKIIEHIDERYNDEMMAKRFCEWKFLK